MIHENGECFSGKDPHTVKDDVCVDCVWFRIRNFGESEHMFKLQEDQEVCLKRLRKWLNKRQNKGVISFSGVTTMLRGLRFVYIKIKEWKSPDSTATYTCALGHLSGLSFYGTGDSASNAIGDAVSKYVENLVGGRESA